MTKKNGPGFYPGALFIFSDTPGTAFSSSHCYNIDTRYMVNAEIDPRHSYKVRRDSYGCIVFLQRGF